ELVVGGDDRGPREREPLREEALRGQSLSRADLAPLDGPADRVRETPVDRAGPLGPASERGEEGGDGHGSTGRNPLPGKWLLIRRSNRSMFMATRSIHPRWTGKVDWLRNRDRRLTGGRPWPFRASRSSADAS